MIFQSAQEVLEKVFAYQQFRGDQAEIIQALIDGNDVLALMPTGGGKSLCYQVPALVREGCAVVISPLIALMRDQVVALQNLGVKAAFLNSSLNWSEVQKVEQAYRSGELDLLYLAPERLRLQQTFELLSQAKIALFAIDEAHCVSQWGHDFRPDYLRIANMLNHWPDVPRIAMTATAVSQTKKEIIQSLGLEKAKQFVASFDRPNIQYLIDERFNERQQLLHFIQTQFPKQSGIVYCLSRNKTERIAAFLSEHGVEALPYHAGLLPQERDANQQRFQLEEGVVMVATIAFGMGIDKPDVRFVAHLDLPKSIEGYYQETGRAGRDGLPAVAWLCYGHTDVMQLKKMLLESPNKPRLEAQIDAMLALCERVECRRQGLLSYFGQTLKHVCGNCDNCLTPPSVWDATTPARMVLSAVYRLYQAYQVYFGTDRIIEILQGKVGSSKAYDVEKLSVFGIAKQLSSPLDKQEWRSVIRQLLVQGYLRLVGEEHQTLFLTEKSRSLLRGEVELKLRRESMRKAGRSKNIMPSTRQAVVQLSPEANERFERLRQWRYELAKSLQVPAYTILQNTTLYAIAQQNPNNMYSLGLISGMGVHKIQHYGAAILNLLADEIILKTSSPSP